MEGRRSSESGPEKGVTITSGGYRDILLREKKKSWQKKSAGQTRNPEELYRMLGETEVGEACDDA